MSDPRYPEHPLSERIAGNDQSRQCGALAVELRLADEAQSRVFATLNRHCSVAKDPIGVGVSGGSDSLALLALANDWAKAEHRKLLVLTVDHGLRPEAADEAAAVARRCQRIGIDHETLRWSPPGGAATQAKARRARHALLAGAVRNAGGSHILLGHTEDDQVETVAMRQRNEASSSGLAGMRTISPSPIWPAGRGIALVRPVLSETRQALQEFLSHKDWEWIDDPSNSNALYERVRVRAELAGDVERRDALLDLATKEDQQRKATAGRLAEWMTINLTCASDGTIRFDPGNLTEADLAEALALLLMAAAGSDQRSALKARQKLAEDILSRKLIAKTLGGAWIAPRQGQIMIARDPGEAAKAPEIKPDFEGVWDGRFQISRMRPEIDLAQTWKPDDAISPMARESVPRGLSSTQFATCLVPARIQMTKYLLEQDSLPL
ncbi:MAG: tRNA lysidine(34) synthetase TilS [Pseudomonadota bacterium]